MGHSLTWFLVDVVESGQWLIGVTNSATLIAAMKEKKNNAMVWNEGEGEQEWEVATQRRNFR